MSARRGGEFLARYELGFSSGESVFIDFEGRVLPVPEPNAGLFAIVSLLFILHRRRKLAT